MRQIKIISKFSYTKNITDIVANYTEVNGCDRVREAAKESYLSATDYHKYQT